MAAYTKEEIRQSVRERYAEIAKEDDDLRENDQSKNCCTGIQVSTPNNAEKVSGCGCGGTESISKIIGYSEKEMAEVPEDANLGLGCGNPVAIASLQPGETVVDLGSGGGFDCFLAAKKVGGQGRVIGVDMTPEMIRKARGNVEKTDFGNVEFRLGEIEHIPVADNSADIIISNCVINLSPDKRQVYQDAFRVLKPGGRLVISDIVATTELPEEIQRSLALISACIGGAATIDGTVAMLERVGFEAARVKPLDGSREIINEWVPGEDAGSYVVSATIQAVKPKKNGD